MVAYFGNSFLRSAKISNESIPDNHLFPPQNVFGAPMGKKGV